MNIFLANVGNRDIALGIIEEYFLTFSKDQDGADLAKELGCKEGNRNISLYVKEHIDQYRDALRLPILAPALSVALQYTQRIDKLVLFATDQPSTEGEHSVWDTIESARLIRTLVPEKFGIAKEDVEIVAIKNNVSEHDQAYRILGDALDDLEEKLQSNGISAVFASIKGGIPAMNAALRERVVQRFGPKAYLIETDEPPRGRRWKGEAGQARILDSWLFRRDAILRLLKHLLDRSDYDGALQLIQLEGIQVPEAEAFLRHALARINMDFEDAAQYLGEQRIGTPQQWKILTEDMWGLQRLADLAYTAQNALERADYATFLSRVTTFCENCRRLLCWVLTDIKVESGHLQFSDVSRVSRPLADHLQSKKLFRFNQAPASPIWRTDRKFFLAAIEWGASTKSEQIKLLVDTVRSRLGSLRGLEELRNDGEHLMKGVSYEDVHEKFPNALQTFPSRAEEILDRIAQLQRLVTGANPPKRRKVYDEINEKVYTLISQWRS